MSIIPGLIATITQRSNYYYVDRKRFWQDGVSLRHPTLNTDALISMAGRRVLRIETRGDYPGGMMDEMRGLIAQVIHDRWPAAREAEPPLYEFKAACPNEGCWETIPIQTLLKAEKDGDKEFPCQRYHKFPVVELLRGIRPSELTLVSDIADLRAEVKAVERQVGEGFTSLERRIGNELANLQSLNADTKQCLNFLVGNATSKLPPRIYALSPIEFDFNNPKPLLGSALQTREVCLTVWCEWENKPVQESSISIPIDAPLVRAMKTAAPKAVQILSVAIAIWSGAGAVQSVLTGDFRKLLEFMHKLGDAADDIYIDAPEFGANDDVSMKGRHSGFRIERHLSADEADRAFAAKLREAALKGGMEQVYCQDGQWRWVSKEAARRLSPTEPRETF